METVSTTGGLARLSDGGDPTLQGDDIENYFKENKETVEEPLLKDAVEVQDACNPTAIALLLHNIGKVLRQLGYGSDQTATHPAFKGVLGKLCSLALIDHSASDAYDQMYK